MVCHEFKGGIGTASRVIAADLGGVHGRRPRPGELREARVAARRRRAGRFRDRGRGGPEPVRRVATRSTPRTAAGLRLDHRRRRHRCAAPPPPMRATRPARRPRDRARRRDRRHIPAATCSRLLDRQSACRSTTRTIRDARPTTSGRRRRRHRRAVRRRHRGDRGGDRQCAGRRDDDDRAGRRDGARPPARSIARDHGPPRPGAGADRVKPQPAVTGAGFSIGTPIRLPYSVQTAVVVADPVVAEQLVQDEPACGWSARRSGSRR